MPLLRSRKRIGEDGKKEPVASMDASWLSSLTFSWVNSFIDAGARGEGLSEADLPRLKEAHESALLSEKMRMAWERELKAGWDKEGMALLVALLRCFWPMQWRTQILLVADSTVHILQAVALGWLVRYFDDPEAPARDGWRSASVIVGTGIAFSFLHHHFFFCAWDLGMQIRLGATLLIYDKLLRLRLASLGKVTSGHVVNLCTADVERFQLAGIFVNYLWEAPLETLAILYFGMQQVGVSFLVGFGALALLVPLQGFCSRQFAKMRAQVAAFADERIKLTSQAITGARLVKISGWEPAMTRQIREVRAKEVHVLMRATQLRALNEALFFAQPALVTLLVFSTYHALGNQLVPSKVFTTLALLYITQFSVGKFLYMAVQSASEAWVAICRIERFLLLRENAPKRVASNSFTSASGGGGFSAAAQRPALTPPAAAATSVDGAEATAAGSPLSLGAAELETIDLDEPRLEEARINVPGPLPLAELPSLAPAPTAVPSLGSIGASGSNSRIVVRGASFHWEEGTDATPGARNRSASAGGVRGSARSIVDSCVGGSGTGGGVAVQGEGPVADGEDQPASPLRLMNRQLSSRLRRKFSSRLGGEESEGEGTVSAPGSAGPQSPRKPALTLASIDLEVFDGELLGVIGPVGAAKSSLLMAVMQEMTAVPAEGGGAGGGAGAGNGQDGSNGGARGGGNGKVGGGREPMVSLVGRVAYASQEPWIITGTVRENVLFGRDFNAARYDRVLRACALETDIARLPNGDLTVIGDRGVNLSGGQKARVALARLCYSDADIYILDDPLSAVDPAVGRRLFSEAVCGLLAGRTRILVTHQVQFLMEPEVDRVLVMQDGRIAASGCYAELVDKGFISKIGDSVAAATISAAPAPAPAHLKGAGLTHSGSDAGKRGMGAAATAMAVAAAAVAADRRVGAVAPIAEVAAEDADDDSDDDDDAANWYDGTGESKGNDGGGGGGELGPSGINTRADRLSDVVGPAMHSGLMRGDLEPSLRADDAKAAATAEAAAANAAAAAAVAKAESEKEPMAGVGGHANAGTELIGQEDKETGKVSWSTYSQYAVYAAGGVLSLVLLLLLVAGQALAIGVTVWLGRWALQTKSAQGDSRWIVGFVGLAAATLVVSILRASATFYCFVHASHVIHDAMLIRVLRAPVLFFDSNPAGRILNRFSKDLGFMDDLLPSTLYDYLTCALMVVGSVLLVCIVNVYVFLALIPCAVYFRFLLQKYTTSSREVKRLDAVTRSPVYGCISETLDGLVTIRAYGQQRRFLADFHDKIDQNTKAYFAYIFTSRWLGFRLDIIVLGLLAAAAYVSVGLKASGSDSINPGLLGASLIYVLQLGGLFQWAVRQAAEVENQMVSVERTLAYSRVEEEAALESMPEHKPPPGWPDRGQIVVRNLWCTYRPGLPPVLCGLNFDIPGGARVGVVGRTGAGKSSFVAALFRLVEYDSVRGGIELDGLKTSDLGLHDLRPSMSAIPQTPFLFSASVRLNMDPFGRYDDAAIWAALDAVQMREYIAAQGGIEAAVAESGANLSVGQRQLLCLARAILQCSRVLVMDEATANIDLQTDALIQEAVRTKFVGCTVIMIAHRLATIIDSDKVIVLSNGAVVEQGHPAELLAAPGSAFASMVSDTGEPTARELRRFADEAYRTSPFVIRGNEIAAAAPEKIDADCRGENAAVSP